MSHCLEADNRGEDFIEINSLNLWEAFGYEAGFLSTILFDVKYPSIFNDFPAFWEVSEFKHFLRSKGL